MPPSIRMPVGLLAAVALLAAGCQEYVFEPAIPALVAVSNTTTTVSATDKADILFVVDDSGSMAGEQANLADNFDAFINAIEARNRARSDQGLPVVDYRIAVVSTSVVLLIDGDGDPSTIEDRRDRYFDSSANGNCATDLEFTADVTPYPAGKFLAAPGNPDILDSRELTQQEIISTFKENVRVGTCGSGQEMGLRAMRLALENRPEFVRENSVLVVAFLSDEEDCSDSDEALPIDLTGAVDYCAEEARKPNGGLLDPVDDYVRFLRAQADNVAVGSIVSAVWSGDTLVADACTDPACEQSMGCSGAECRGYPYYCGGQSGGSRYLQLAQAIGGLQDSICQADFSTTLEELADVVVPVTCVDLPAAPYQDDPSLMLLEIEKGSGDAVLCNSPQAGDTCQSNPAIGWEYLPGEQRICLCLNNTASDCRIEPGDTYTVSFVAEACSPDAPCTPAN